MATDSDLGEAVPDDKKKDYVGGSEPTGQGKHIDAG